MSDEPIFVAVPETTLLSICDSLNDIAAELVELRKTEVQVSRAINALLGNQQQIASAISELTRRAKR